MAHYAFLDENNIVTEVIAGIDETELIEGLDTETWYGNFRGQVCKRTSYNNKITKTILQAKVLHTIMCATNLCNRNHSSRGH
jgi:hypothetical protein